MTEPFKPEPDLLKIDPEEIIKKIPMEVARYQGAEKIEADGKAKEIGIEAWYVLYPEEGTTQTITQYAHGAPTLETVILIGENKIPITFRKVLGGYLEVEEVPGSEGQLSKYTLIHKTLFDPNLLDYKPKPGAGIKFKRF